MTCSFNGASHSNQQDLLIPIVIIKKKMYRCITMKTSCTLSQCSAYHPPTPPLWHCCTSGCALRADGAGRAPWPHPARAEPLPACVASPGCGSSRACNTALSHLIHAVVHVKKSLQLSRKVYYSRLELSEYSNRIYDYLFES